MKPSEIREELKELSTLEYVGPADLERYKKENENYRFRIRQLEKEMRKYRYLKVDNQRGGTIEIIEDEWYELNNKRIEQCTRLESSDKMFERYQRFVYLKSLLKETEEQINRQTQKSNNKPFIHTPTNNVKQLTLFDNK